jgi:hypothetical protein
MQTLLTSCEVDRLLRYPRGRSLRLARTGRLPAIRLPDGELRFRVGDIEALLVTGRAAGSRDAQGVRDAR